MSAEIPRRFSLEETKLDPKLVNRITSADGDETVGYWDGQSIEELAKELERIEEDTDANYAGLPHNKNIPDDIKNQVEKDYPVWACDVNGRCIVGEQAVDIEHVDTIRAHYTEKYGGIEQFKEKLIQERQKLIDSMTLDNK